ncbi:MAG: zinc ribbon domain-containing protein [bacterium]|nr:zinc ribbon domain-containing protein [bacterium]
MPLFDYHCKACGDDFTELRKGDEKDAPLNCPQCGSAETHREVSAFAFGGGGGSGGSAPSFGGSSGFS